MVGKRTDNAAFEKDPATKHMRRSFIRDGRVSTIFTFECQPKKQPFRLI